VDLLTCQIFSGKMKIIHVMEDEEIIEKTLDHFGIWKVKGRPRICYGWQGEQISGTFFGEQTVNI
jgi:hypothetical protein